MNASVGQWASDASPSWYRQKRRTTMFSPIVLMASWMTCSTVRPVTRQILGQGLELFGPGHKIGLAVHLDQPPDPAAGMDVGDDQPIGRRPPRLPGPSRHPPLPEDGDCPFEISPSLRQACLP